MKSFNTSDARIAKALLAKADKLIPKHSEITSRIEQIEEEYRKKCEEKKAQLVVEEEKLAIAIECLEDAMDSICNCSLDEARESLFGDGGNVVADEDADNEAPETAEEPEDDDLNVVDEDEPVGEVDEDEPMGEVDEPAPEWNQEAKDDDDWNGFHSASGADELPDNADEDINEDDDDDDIPEPEDGLLWNVNDFFNN